MTKRDITGIRFGRLVFIEFVQKRKKANFRCDCGAITTAWTSNVTRGMTKSCGCLLKEGNGNRVHNDTPTNENPGLPRLYNIWRVMKSRCDFPNVKSWMRYGGRGIKVCDEWRNYLVFKSWALNNGYAANLTIERIDNDGGYCPDNCRWATINEQALNKSNTLFVTYKGERLPLKTLCRRANRNYYSIRSRLVRGWSEADALADIVA